MATNYIEYTHIDSTISTIDDFINQPFSIATNYINDVNKFLTYKGDTDKTNRERIEEMYDEGESYPLLKINTKLLIKVDESNREIVSIFGKDQVLEQRDISTFLSTHLVRLLSDVKYKKSEKYDIFQNFTVTEQYPTVSVWIWSRALNKILNVTNYVQSITTRVNKSGGNFTISLSPITLLSSCENQSTGLVDDGKNFINESNVYKNEKRKDRSVFFFHKNIQANDLVFIKFEELEISNEDRKNYKFEINKSLLSNQVYDMIGLVDDNRQSISPQNNDVEINVTGRDLTKLLVEDSDYFIPQLFTVGAADFYMNNLSDNKLIDRNFVSGNYKILFSYSYRKISDSIQFIINQCSHLGIIPDDVDLFSSYGDRRSQVYRIKETNINSEIDIYNSQYINKSTLNTNLSKKKLFLPKINTKGVENNVNNILPDKKFNTYNKVSTELHKGVWQIIKLEIDSALDNRRLVDHSISQPDGNLISNINKICQEPFVEFFGDTYGDMYTFIVRQPPFSKEQILKYIDSNIGCEDNIQALNGNSRSIIIDIYDEDIQSESLFFDDANAISWYQMSPKELNIMNNNSILSYFPIVFLPEYAEVWGNRRLEIVNNYASYESIRDKKQDVNLQTFVKAAANDFKYMIESTMYLPFTRKGSIVLGSGDRRIKIGTWIRHNGTKELFYVEDVQQDYSISTSSIDRTTILQVSRGMYEPYIKGKNEDIVNESGYNVSKKISYFDLVNTDIIKDTIIERATVSNNDEVKVKNKYKTSFLVDKDIFIFFLKRRQMNG